MIRPGRHSSHPLPSCVLLFVVCLLISACTTSVPLSGRLDVDPLVEPLPLKMAVHYPSGFRERVHVTEAHWGTTRVPVGGAAVEFIDQLAASMFEHVEVVEEIGLRGNPSRDLDGYLRPTLEHHETSVGEEVTRVVSTFLFTLYSHRGEEVAVFTLTGVGIEEGVPIFDSDESLIGAATRAAWREIAAKFITGFRSQHGVDRWLEERSR